MAVQKCTAFFYFNIAGTVRSMIKFPVRQYPAMAALAIQHDFMMGWFMGMAMNQGVDIPVLPENVLNSAC